MRYVVNRDEMQEYDRRTTDKLGVPSLLLMEQAAIKVAEQAISYAHNVNANGRCTKILVLAGTGNNGGDGMAAARLLLDRDYDVDVTLVGDKKKCTPQTALQLSILENYGLSVRSILPDMEYDIIVDALFGIGLCREITGTAAEFIRKVNSMKGYKIAVDIPSGVGADDGKIYGIAFQADVTVTFGFLKRGLYFYPGSGFAGSISCVDIGISKRSFPNKPPEMFTYTEPVSDILPKRAKDGNKGTFGKVLLVAGSKDMAGASLLAGESAFRSGAGMVKIVTCEENRVVIQERLPEAMLLTYPSEAFDIELKASLDWADSVAVGPGLSQNKQAEELLSVIISECKVPLVLDADALNLVSKNQYLQEAVERRETVHNKTILTPHMGELARLLGSTVANVKDDPVKAAKTAAEKYNCILVAKDVRTLVYQKGEPIFLNTAGNNGMATAGSGDVLTGVIAGLCASSKNTFDNAAAGVYLHAKAGDSAATEVGETSMTASDIIRHLQTALGHSQGKKSERY